MFKCMEAQGISNIKQGVNNKINCFIQIDMSIVHVALP